ncbi:MAG: VRR-NUC domain-containing protein [Phascolarctobacterium sp.]|nr:VRR-NUC domain-containing protein [Candidatus Phascolarctobacterium caballi]
MYNRKRSEATEQERVMRWATFYEERFTELKLLYHVPNGGSRNQLEAANLKRQGVKAGVPDLTLPAPRQQYHGLYVEMKWGKNKTTEKQDWWIEQLRKQGYKVVVCYGAEEAMDEIAKYLDIEAETGRKVE